MHEVKTDRRPGKNLAYLSYYAGGLRVLSFGPTGMKEIGHYIAPGGNNFWGIYPVSPGSIGGSTSVNGRPFLLMSDRDSGLWILRYTGRE